MSGASQPGPRPGWNGWGLGLAAVCVAAFVILFAPAAPVPDDDPPLPEAPGPTITLDDLEAMLTNDLPPSSTFQVETPDGPVTVIVPESTTTSTTTTTQPPPTTRPTTTTTTVPLRPRPPADVVDDILDDLVPTTIPEGVGDDG